MTAPAFSLPDRTDGDVRSPKTAELLTRRLRRMIASGELRDGDFLPREAELMAHFGVSRPTLREAVRVLESESLVEVRRGSRTGAKVRVPGPETVARPAALLLQLAGTTIAEVLTARLGIEPMAAWLLAERGSDDTYQRLETILERAKSDLTDRVAVSPIIAEFHHAVVEGSRNRALVVASGMLHEIIGHHMATAARVAIDNEEPAATERRYRHAVRSYGKLLRLARAGESDEAERFWRHYLEQANASLLRSFEPGAVVDFLE